MDAKFVLHLVNGTRLLGAERVALELARRLPKTEYKACLGMINGDAAMQAQLISGLDGIDVDVIDFSDGGIFRKLFSLLMFCRQHQVELIHSHGYKSNFLSLFIKMIHPTIRLVATNHNYILTTFRTRIYRWLDLFIMRFFHRIVAVSDEALEDMRIGGFPVKRVRVIDNGVNIDLTSKENSRKLLLELIKKSPDSMLLGVSARLAPEKAHADLIKAFATLAENSPNMCLLIFGDGPLRNELEDMVKQLSLAERVLFLGHRPDVRQLVPGLDLFVLPSLQEGLPMALLEAMASYVPVIASRVGAIPRAIDHQKQGILFEAGQVGQLANSIRMLVQDSKLREQLAIAGYERVISSFSSERMAQDYMEEYVSALGT